jgi:hypothetical protein
MHIAPRQGGRVRRKRFGELETQKIVGDCHLYKDIIYYICPL